MRECVCRNFNKNSNRDIRSAEPPANDNYQLHVTLDFNSLFFNHFIYM